MSVPEEDFRFVGKVSQPRTEGIAIPHALFRREPVIDPVVSQRVIAEVAALAIADDASVTPLLHNEAAILTVFVAQLPLDQIRETAVHQVLRNSPTVGNEFNGAPSDGRIGALLHYAIVIGKRTGAAAAKLARVVNQQARMVWFVFKWDLAASAARRQRQKQNRVSKDSRNCWHYCATLILNCKNMRRLIACSATVLVSAISLVTSRYSGG